MAVEKNDDTWTFTCPACGFESSGWTTRTGATVREKQHQKEHETGKPMPELTDFTRKD